MSDRSEVIKEIADVLEVLDAIKGFYGITDEEVITVKNKKLSSNGAFNKRLFLEYVEKRMYSNVHSFLIIKLYYKLIHAEYHFWYCK